MDSRLDKGIAVGTLLVVVVTALTHGAVEPWSVAVFEGMAATLLMLWAVKVVRDQALHLEIPASAFPLAALFGLGLIQSVGFVNASSGVRRSLSMDAEATQAALLVILFLFCFQVIAANFFVVRDRLRLAANFLTFFGFGLSILALF